MSDKTGESTLCRSTKRTAGKNGHRVHPGVLSRTVFRRLCPAEVPEFVKGFLGEVGRYSQDTVYPVSTPSSLTYWGREFLSVPAPALHVTPRAVAEVTVCD